jgi:predicted enzyme related to lactoylglutathione lyase
MAYLEVDDDDEQNVGIMTASHMKTGVEPTPETSCISDIPQTKSSVQHNKGAIVTNP